jgi:hypothetical protein
VLFRPLDDGTLTDADDEEVTVPPDADVSLAHDTTVAAGEAARWQEHLADYDVTPLFPQFGRGTRPLPEPAPEDERITDVKGHLIEAFALRGRATKLGWVRGPAEDGGVFSTYLKEFPALGLRAQLHFTGNFLPEENRTVALEALDVAVVTPEAGREILRPLAQVPAVMLAECYQDLWAIAGSGTGYDPDWEKKASL